MDTVSYVVPVPSPKTLSKRGRPPGVSPTTKLHARKLLEVFKFPPEDYDGSNVKLAGYVQLSVSQLKRVLGYMEEIGVIERRTVRRPVVRGFPTCWMDRTIVVKQWEI